jgi:hypothetical protein
MSFQITSQSVRSKMKLPPPMQGPYARIVMAGQKIMFSQQMTPQITALMKGQGTLGQKIGNGVTALLAILIDQSNHTLPPQLLIPAGVELCTDFADLLRGSGVQVADNDTSEGIETMVAAVMQKLGVTPQKLLAAKSGAAQQPPTPGPTPAPAPAQQPSTTDVATDDEGN